jgi:hypothetical protein
MKRRIIRELQDLENSDNCGIESVTYVTGSDELIAEISTSIGGEYDSQIRKILFKYPPDYPFKPPDVVLTADFSPRHPLINTDTMDLRTWGLPDHGNNGLSHPGAYGYVGEDNGRISVNIKHYRSTEFTFERNIQIGKAIYHIYDKLNGIFPHDTALIFKGSELDHSKTLRT